MRFQPGRTIIKIKTISVKTLGQLNDIPIVNGNSVSIRTCNQKSHNSVNPTLLLVIVCRLVFVALLAFSI